MSNDLFGLIMKLYDVKKRQQKYSNMSNGTDIYTNPIHHSHIEEYIKLESIYNELYLYIRNNFSVYDIERITKTLTEYGLVGY